MVENLFRLLAIFPDLCENPLIQEMLGLFSYRAIYGPNHYAHLFHTEFSAILLEITESPEILVNWNRGINHFRSRLMLTEKENWIGVVGGGFQETDCMQLHSGLQWTPLPLLALPRLLEEGLINYNIHVPSYIYHLYFILGDYHCHTNWYAVFNQDFNKVVKGTRLNERIIFKDVKKDLMKNLHWFNKFRI